VSNKQKHSKKDNQKNVLNRNQIKTMIRDKTNRNRINTNCISCIVQ